MVRGKPSSNVVTACRAPRRDETGYSARAGARWRRVERGDAAGSALHRGRAQTGGAQAGGPARPRPRPDPSPSRRPRPPPRDPAGPGPRPLAPRARHARGRRRANGRWRPAVGRASRPRRAARASRLTTCHRSGAPLAPRRPPTHVDAAALPSPAQAPRPPPLPLSPPSGEKLRCHVKCRFRTSIVMTE
ncbi:translation initiation factor IF-2-like [Schistocerca nitens]|uniref:translation initiation factor IF-2-like n=1 Tax=Schistocerca nitens TaxID=7011 RepID=UPI002118DF38|nr:translation initiation factor IF-2-like [Schistocerca nitens]